MRSPARASRSSPSTWPRRPSTAPSSPPSASISTRAAPRSRYRWFSCGGTPSRTYAKVARWATACATTSAAGADASSWWSCRTAAASRSCSVPSCFPPNCCSVLSLMPGFSLFHSLRDISTLRRGDCYSTLVIAPMSARSSAYSEEVGARASHLQAVSSYGGQRDRHRWQVGRPSGRLFAFRPADRGRRTARRCPSRPVKEGCCISVEPRINDRIRAAQVRVVGADGEQLGVMDTQAALRIAGSADLDLVEVAPLARPPVAKMMDYSKYKYEQAIKAKEARRKQNLVVLKEMKMRPKIDDHDYETKKGHVERFLKQGHKVKVTIMFRGREMAHTELGRRLLERLATDIVDIAHDATRGPHGRPAGPAGAAAPGETSRHPGPSAPLEEARRRSTQGRPRPCPK